MMFDFRLSEVSGRPGGVWRGLVDARPPWTLLVPRGPGRLNPFYLRMWR